jgi:glycerol-3-phosphate acyltransferase PlsY
LALRDSIRIALLSAIRYLLLSYPRFPPFMTWLLIPVVCYLIGSFPSGYLVARSQGIDIREHGSKNIGATNVLRVMGKKWGYLVFFLDSFKGFIAVKIGEWIASGIGGSTTVGAVIAAIACILGHNFTIWLGFKGGKGMATSFGVVLALFSPFVVIAAVLVWLIVFFVGRFVSLASILAAVALPIAVIFLGGKTGNDFWILITFSILAAAMAILRHRSNISRLLNGTESRFGKK